MISIKLSDIVDIIIKEDSFKNDFETLTMPLLYEKYPYKECESHLIQLRDFLLANDL